MTWHAHVMRALASLPVVADEHYLIAQCDHATLAAAMREAGLVADALIVDAPYSERTHAGHADGTLSANHVASWAASRAAKGRNDAKTRSAPSIRARAQRLGQERRGIDYAHWSADDVGAFLDAWSDRCGWLVSLTDHVLAVEWESACDERGRYTFAPIACVESGSRIRLSGDGPPQWSTWLVAAAQVSRPASRDFLDEWHAKRWEAGLAPRGAYVGSPERKNVTGGKPLWLMRAVVGDYSRPGDLVVDPCMGAGTTLVAAVELGRRAIGCEPDAGRYEIAAKRLRETRPQLRMRLDCNEVRGKQIGLLGGE